ncbi:3beta-hydroxysteroid dehydrogenase [Paramyrothecium foliicola]|nr:3beta-hydroxysteroid dehydrogenase [Paramyrothecium foliicola]
MSATTTYQGKTVIVTGSGGGVGKAIADMYLSRGANVIVCDVHEERLLARSEEYAASHPDRAMVVRADVTDEESVKSLVSAAASRFGGRLDVVVHSAGIMDRFDPAAELERALWDRVVGVNLTGAFLVTKHAIRRMEACGRGGAILFIGSNGSSRGLSGGAAYVASQHGLVGLARNTASTYGARGIYSAVLALGAVEDTNISDAFDERGVNEEGMGMLQGTHPGYVMRETCVAAADVARYVGFLTEESVARGTNGNVVSFNNNWPAA